jgi:hypothetical protein
MGLRGLKINDGIQTLPRPSRKGNLANIVAPIHVKIGDKDHASDPMSFVPIFHSESNQIEIFQQCEERHLKTRTNPASNMMMNTMPQTKARQSLMNTRTSAVTLFDKQHRHPWRDASPRKHNTIVCKLKF